MAENAWKVAQRKICRAWGFETGAWRGEKGSDGRGDGPISLEVKYSKRGTPEGAWIEQARDQGRAEGRPWVLVVVPHGRGKPVAVVDHRWLLNEWQVAEAARRVERAYVALKAHDDERVTVVPCPTCAALENELEVAEAALLKRVAA